MLKRISLTIALSFYSSIPAIALPSGFSLEQNPLEQPSEVTIPLESSNSFFDQDLETTTPNSSKSFSEPKQRQETTIPKSSAVTVTFCSKVKFDPEKKESYPITLFLARPIMDSNGNIIAPVNSLVRGRLEAKESEEDDDDDEDNESTQIKVEALVIGGRFIPVETSPLSIPALADVQRESSYTSSSYSNRSWDGPVIQVADGLLDSGLLENQGIVNDSIGNFLRLGLTVARGVTAGINEPKPPEETRVMEVPQGIQLIFPLRQAVTLPTMAAQKNPYFSSQTSAGSACSENSGSGYNSSPYYETDNQNNQNRYRETNYQNRDETDSQNYSEESDSRSFNQDDNIR
jgi:hypothetical protein